MTDERMTDERRKWHLEKGVSVSHIVGTIGMAGSVLIWGMKMDTRVALLEQFVIQQREIDRQQDDRTKDAVNAVRSDLKDISNKLDQLILRQK